MEHTYQNDKTTVTIDLYFPFGDDGDFLELDIEYKGPFDSEYVKDCFSDFLFNIAPPESVIVMGGEPYYLSDERLFRRASISDLWPRTPDYDIDRVRDMLSAGFKESDFDAYMNISGWPKAQAWFDWLSLTDDDKRDELNKKADAAEFALAGLLSRLAAR